MRPLYFCGDIHGEFKKLVYTVITEKKITEADVLVLGDFGVGFDRSIFHDYQVMEKRLVKHDIHIYAIRGNHDDPEYFTGAPEYTFPRLHFLKDHEIVEIGGRKIYPIGGANSTDVTWRKESKNKIWWENEGPVMKKDGLPGYVDVIVSHAAPLSFLPTTQRFAETPQYQWYKILDERRYLDHVLHEVRCQYWFYGHYHDHYSDSYGEVQSYGLGIMELFECPEIKQLNPQGSI